MLQAAVKALGYDFDEFPNNKYSRSRTQTENYRCSYPLLECKTAHRLVLRNSREERLRIVISFGGKKRCTKHTRTHLIIGTSVQIMCFDTTS